MTRLERRGRLLLRAYPAGYRQQRGEEILGTLLEATPAGRSWPRPRDSRALILGGLRARAVYNQRLPIAASLRLAALLGVCVYLSFSAIGYLRGWWIPAGLLLCVTALAPWLGPRTAVISAVVTAGTMLALTAAWSTLTAASLLPAGTLDLALVVVAILSRGPDRPPRAWLWLPGPAVAAWLVALSWATGWFPMWVVPLVTPLPLLAGLAVAVLAWIVTDPRPAIGLATCLTLVGLSQILVGTALLGRPGLMLLDLARLAAIWLGSAIVLAVPAFWRLRRRAVL